MGKIIVTEYISIDGVIEAPGGDEDYEHVNWALEFERGEEGQRFKEEETFASAAQLLGRVTYEGFAAAWPSMEGELAEKFNSMPKYVISKTLRDPAWNNTTVLDGNPVEESRALKERVDGDIVVHGSAQLAQALFAAGLVDQVNLMIHPLALGAGKRLFSDNGSRMEMPLIDAKVVGDGLQIVTYGPVRAGG